MDRDFFSLVTAELPSALEFPDTGHPLVKGT